jgi:hypothetical protein
MTTVLAPRVPDQSWTVRQGVSYGAVPDERGPLGGGAGYTPVVTGGQVTVRGVEELVKALAEATPGTVVFLPGDVALDLTEWAMVDKLILGVPAGVTLASDRGHAGSPGALLFSEYLGTSPLIRVLGDGARITGLRLRGPDPQRRLAFHYRCFYDPRKLYPVPQEAFYRLPNSGAIQTTAANLEVDNCEISGWSHCGIYLQDGRGHHLHHNFIHHCQRMGLGYGVTINQQAQALIDYNLLQDNKHHLAGTGTPGCGYEACHNLVLPDTESHAHPLTGKPYGQDHLFDMHGGRDRKDGTEIAGAFLKVHHNTFLPRYVPVVIRGVPQDAAEIHHNWFYRQAPDAKAVISDGQTRVFDNAFGPA